MHVKASQPSAALVAVVQPRPMWLQVGNAGCGCSRRWSRRWRCARLWLCGWEWDCQCMCVCVLLHDVFVCCAGYAKHVRIERDKNVKATRRDAEI